MRRPNEVFKNGLLFLLVTLICFIVFEALLRYSLFGDSSWASVFRSPLLLVDSLDDNGRRFRLRWKLEELEKHPEMLTQSSFDSLLGWVLPRKTKDNPLQIITDVPYETETIVNEPAVLFFGDSFVEGRTDFPHRIPNLLDSTIKDAVVLNFGVSGYGVDQTYLRMKRVLPLFHDVKLVIFGILYGNINRCSMRVRELPKPYFEFKGDSLVLKGIPIPSDRSLWYELYPPDFNRIYTVQLIQGLFRWITTRYWVYSRFFFLHPTERDTRKNERKKLYRGLIELTLREANSQGVNVLFVLFPHRYHIIKTGWYETYSYAMFSELNADFLDMRIPMKRYMDENAYSYWDLYTLNAHPNEKENEVIAHYIRKHLNEQYNIK